MLLLRKIGMSQWRADIPRDMEIGPTLGQRWYGIADDGISLERLGTSKRKGKLCVFKKRGNVVIADSRCRETPLRLKERARRMGEDERVRARETHDTKEVQDTQHSAVYAHGTKEKRGKSTPYQTEVYEAIDKCWQASTTRGSREVSRKEIERERKVLSRWKGYEHRKMKEKEDLKMTWNDTLLMTDKLED